MLKHPGRRLALLLAAILAALSGCTTPHHTVVMAPNPAPAPAPVAAVSYAPAAYGEVIGGIGHCYYLDDPSEVTQLIAAGRCPATWIPTPMPAYWHDEYDPYYASTAYTSAYVLQIHLATFNTRETSFERTNATAIATASSKAVYRGSNGATITGPSSAKLKFGSGSGSLGLVGGGSLRSATPLPSPTAPRGSSSTGLVGGGSLRSGGNSNTSTPPRGSAPRPVGGGSLRSGR